MCDGMWYIGGGRGGILMVSVSWNDRERTHREGGHVTLALAQAYLSELFLHVRRGRGQ